MDLQQALEWYAELARTPGWKEYTWHRVKELARDHPSVFWRLPELLTEAMQRGASEPEENRMAPAGTDAGRLSPAVPVVRVSS